MNKPLHIVCLDAPAPANYGGAIDMFYKVKALAQIGYQIHLHYFNYRAGRSAAELEALCAEVHKYSRSGILDSYRRGLPYIVGSRIHSQLIENLNKDSAPILLEGLHCAGIISQIQNRRRIILRMHNEEVRYYQHLKQAESNLIKKAYFSYESRLLQRFQLGLPKDISLAVLSETDLSIFEKTYGFTHTAFVPCFIPWQSVQSQTGFGEYCLYHGNLAISENNEAAVWLVQNVFAQLDVPFVVAGSGASERLKKEVATHKNSKLVNDPQMDEIEALVRDAHINVLPSLNATGVKLKLLNAVLNGRHCITNSNGLAGSGINAGVHECNNPEEWKQAVLELMIKPFEPENVRKREEVLGLYNNKRNAEKLSALW